MILHQQEPLSFEMQQVDVLQRLLYPECAMPPYNEALCLAGLDPLVSEAHQGLFSILASSLLLDSTRSNAPLKNFTSTMTVIPWAAAVAGGLMGRPRLRYPAQALLALQPALVPGQLWNTDLLGVLPLGLAKAEGPPPPEVYLQNPPRQRRSKTRRPQLT